VLQQSRHVFLRKVFVLWSFFDGQIGVRPAHSFCADLPSRTTTRAENGWIAMRIFSKTPQTWGIRSLQNTDSNSALNLQMVWDGRKG
jgi:hypothetical protein